MPRAGRAPRSGRRSRSRCSAPRVPQRSVRVGAVQAIRPAAFGEVAVGRGVAELDGASDAERGEARGVLEVRRTGRARPAGAGHAATTPHGSPRRRRAPRGSRGRRSRARRPASRRRAARPTTSASSSPLVIETPEPSSSQAVPEPRAPSMNAFRYPIRNQSSPIPERRPSASSSSRRSCGQRLPDAQRQRALLPEALPEPRCAEPAVLVVDRRDAARVREPEARSHRPRRTRRR